MQKIQKELKDFFILPFTVALIMLILRFYQSDSLVNASMNSDFLKAIIKKAENGESEYFRNSKKLFVK